MKSRFASIRLGFQLRIAVRIALLGITLAGLLWIWDRGDLPAVALILVLACLAQFVSLLAFINTEHRKLERFLDALAFDDLTLRLSEDDWDQQLASAANHVLASVRSARVETQAKATYLNALVKHIPVAILALDERGDIVLHNNAARQLFGLARLGHVDDLAVLGAHLPKALRAMGAGQRRMIRAASDNQVLDLKVSATEIRLAPEEGASAQLLLAMENIHRELDAREITAWRDLIRVLTHEIMNSVTPIASLARTVDAMARDLSAARSDTETVDDIHDALATIVRRSEGLIAFVEGYRRLTQVPQPKLEDISVGTLFDDAVRLVRESFDPPPVFEIKVEPATLKVSADPSLMQQALTNIVRNACFAVQDVDKPRVNLRAQTTLGRTQLIVEDNGCGIEEDELDQIFIPFFTTRAGGSGVGMTLARQIMVAHGGTIGVRSARGGTTVTMTL